MREENKEMEGRGGGERKRGSRGRGRNWEGGGERLDVT